MKKIAAMLFVGLLVTQFAACQKATTEQSGGPSEDVAQVDSKAGVLDCSAVTSEALKGKVKDPANVTKEEYVAILDAMQCCTVSEQSFSIDKKTCAAMEALDLLRKEKAKLPALSSVTADLVKHSSPIVRGYAYASFASLFGAGKTNLAMAKEALQNEKDPYALQQLVAGISNEGNKDADVGKFLIDMSKHENMFVRRKAAIALGNSWSDKVEGAVDAVIAMLDDPDENTAKLACSGAGKLDDEKVIEPIIRILNDDSKVKLHADCIRGLSVLWFDYPFHEKHHEAAYRATVDYFSKTPRTDKIPAWSAVSVFTQTANTKGAFDTWKTKATWFKPDEFIQLMTDIVKDPGMNWLGRTPAIKVIGAFGGKAALEKIGPEIEALNDQKAEQIKDAYRKELEAAK